MEPTRTFLKPKSAAERVLLVAFLLSFALAIAKFVGYAATGSLIVLTSAFDSLSDTLTSWLNSRMQRLALKDPDADHPYGYSGYDVVSGLIQGTVMVGIGIFLCNEIIRSLIETWHHPPAPQTPAVFTTGLIVLLMAALGGGAISLFLKRTERRIRNEGHRSISLLADIAHYRSDMLTNVLQAIGFFCVYLSAIQWLEYIFASIGIAFLLHSGVQVLRLAFRDIMQTDETGKFKAVLMDAIMATDVRIKNVHLLRVRTHGVKRFVDFHLTLPEQLTLKVAHEIGEKVTRTIIPLVPSAEVLVHFDPDSFPVEPDLKPKS